MSTIYYKTARNYYPSPRVQSAHVPQPFLNYGGLSKFLKDDYKYNYDDSSNIIYSKQKPAPLSQSKRAISARPGMNRNTNMDDERQKRQYNRYIIGKTNPNNVEEAQNSFWMTHINSSDVYHSFIKGTNPWARSSAFTQPLKSTRGAIGWYQNAYNNSMFIGFPGISEEKKYMLLNKWESEREIRENEKLNKVKIGEAGIRQVIVDKILKGCAKKGWIGLRALKCYLRNLSPHKCDIIDKNTFIYYLDKQGIRLELGEINEICAIFDKNKNDHINYIEFLNAIRYVTEFRAHQIEEFKEQVKEKNEKYILFSKLLRILDMRFHPEAMRYKKSAMQIRNEFINNWDALKKDDIISEEHFKQFFYDISSVVDNDRDFTQILKALGYK